MRTRSSRTLLFTLFLCGVVVATLTSCATRKPEGALGEPDAAGAYPSASATPVPASPEDPIAGGGLLPPSGDGDLLGDEDELDTKALAEVTEAAARELSPLDGRQEASVSDRDWESFVRRFDRVVWGEGGPSEYEALRNECSQAAKSHPFCWSVRILPTLSRYRAHLSREYVAPTPRVANPVAIQVDKKGGITGWDGLRKAALKDVLKTLQVLPPEEQLAIGRRALKEKRCPNRIAVAVAALLEDDSTTRPQFRNIAQLFEKGARCSKKEPYDRDNYLQRAALYFWRAQEYKSAARTLAGAKPVDAFSGRSLFWLYRARKRAGDSSGAESAYKRLRTMHSLSFHAILLGLERGDDPGERLLTANDPSETHSKRLAVNRLIELADRLNKHGATRTAPLVARLALEKQFHAEAPVRLHIARMADPNAKVRTMPGLLIGAPRLWSRAAMEAAYPQDFLAAAKGLSAKVDPLLLLALCRKESAFDPRAVSIADARGLCQLQPATAKRYGANDRTDLFDPHENMNLAGRYIDKLLKDFNGELPLALAAYNAGEDAVQRWRKIFPADDPILFVDLIPYRETRDYVAQVLANYYWYRRLYGTTSATEPFAALLKTGNRIR